MYKFFISVVKESPLSLGPNNSDFDLSFFTVVSLHMTGAPDFSATLSTCQ